MADWNAQIIEEFRANGGRVGGNFEGAPVTLLHHRGRKSGREFVAPVMYLADESDRIYAEQARRYAGFAEYETRAAGVRTIPVLALRRSTD